MYVEMHPDTLVLSAWESANHGRDRTGGAFGADVVRFQSDWSRTSPEGTQAGSNILSELKRGLTTRRRLQTLLGGADGIYEKATQGASQAREGFMQMDSDDRDEIDDFLERQIAAQKDAADSSVCGSS